LLIRRILGDSRRRFLGGNRFSVGLLAWKENFVDSLAAALRDLLGAPQRLEPVHGRLQEVDRIRVAEALREDVADPGQLEHGAHAAAGDDAGSLARGAQEDARGIVVPLFGTWKRFFFASSTAFEMASGTSRAFP
jgi:hypothetical protein